jgi:hypothetical protein
MNDVIAACLSSPSGDSLFHAEFANKEESTKIRYMIWHTVSQLFKILFNRYVKFALGNTSIDTSIVSSIVSSDEIIFYRNDGEKEPNVKIRCPKISLQSDKIIVEMYVQILTANYSIWPIENFCTDVIELIKLIKNVKNIGELIHVYKLHNS